MLGAYWNVEGCGHEWLDFHAFAKALFNLQVLVPERFRRLVLEGGGG